MLDAHTDVEKLARFIHDQWVMQLGRVRLAPGSFANVNEDVLRFSWPFAFLPGARLQLFSDSCLPAKWLEFVDLPQDFADEVTHAVGGDFKVIPKEALWNDAEAMGSQGAILRLVLAREPADESRLLGLVARALRNTSADVRFEAATAALLLNHHELRAAIRAALNTEVDPGVHSALEFALKEMSGENAAG